MKRRMVVFSYTEKNGRILTTEFEYGEPRQVARFLRTFTKEMKKEGVEVTVLANRVWEETKYVPPTSDFLALQAFDLAWNIGVSTGEGGGVREILSKLCSTLVLGQQKK